MMKVSLKLPTRLGWLVVLFVLCTRARARGTTRKLANIGLESFRMASISFTMYGHGSSS